MSYTEPHKCDIGHFLRVKILLSILLILLMFAPIASATWWNSSYSNAVFLPSTSTIGVFSLNVSNAIGINNATDIYLNGNSKFADLSDLRVVIDNTTEQPFWFDNATNNGYVVLWINKTIAGSLGIYYNNTNPAATTKFNLSQVMVYADGWNGRWNYTYAQGSGASQTWATQENGTMMQTNTASSSNKNLYITNTVIPAGYSVTVKGKYVGSFGTGSMLLGAYLGRDAAFDIAAVSGAGANNITGNNIIQDNNAYGTGTANAKVLLVNDYFMIDSNTTGTVQRGRIYPVNERESGWASTAGFTTTTAKRIGLYAGQTAATAYQYWYAWNGQKLSTGAWSSEVNGFIDTYSNSKTNNNSLTIYIANGESVTFNLTTIRGIDNYCAYGDATPTCTLTATSGTSLASTHTFNSIGTTFWNLTIRNTSIPVNASLNWTVVVTNFTTPTLISPVNGSSITYGFPPQITPINMTWTSSTARSSHIQVASDINFNLIEGDATTTNQFYTFSLGAGDHYWRVQELNATDGTLGAYSLISKFTLVQTTSALNGTVINGVVYEFINGVQTPVSGASVYLFNATETHTALTGSNGYFQFSNLGNATFGLYSIKQGYDNSQNFEVTTVFNATVTVNIPMRIFISPYVPNFAFEKFVVRSLFDTRYPGVTVNVYQGNSLTILFTGVTDSMGQATFQLVKDTYYRVEFSGGGLPNTIVRYVYGKDEEYVVWVIGGVPSSDVAMSNVSANLSYYAINATDSNMTLNYTDNSGSTLTLTFFVLNITNATQTQICIQTLTGVSVASMGCSVNHGARNSYIWGYNATSSKYPFIQESKGITFGVIVKTTLATHVTTWLSIVLIVVVASIFSPRNIKIGAMVVPVMAGMLMYWGWFVINPLYIAITIVLGVLVYMRKSEIKVNTQ